MKRGLILLTALLLVLVGCAKPIQTVDSANNQVTTTVDNAPVEQSSPAIFKLITDNAKKSPPEIKGIIKNIGNSTGSAKVTAQIFYAKVVVQEEVQTVSNVAPGAEANFSITMDSKNQWTSYKVTVESN